MPGRKRSDDEAEASTSAPTHARFKRLKEAANGSSHNRNEGEQEEEEDEFGPERSVEEDELEEGDDAVMVDESTQGVVGATGEAEIGVIEKVSLTNFMCHDRLEVLLGPKLNFIVGHNGSGKSAILTGITIALGGKATATSRGNSLKSFVKEGKQSALVEVTLKNTGDEAYKPHLYKNKIIIERLIRADGTGTWKIKSADKKLISTRREELNAICDHANIQVDNPMNILTQDAARKFLSSSHSTDKYDFFLRGTQLSQLADEYDVIQKSTKTIQDNLNRKAEGLPLLRQKAQEAMQLLEVVQKAADQKKKIAELREKLVWACVEEKEKELELLMERIERIRIKRERLEEKVATSLEMQEGYENTITELEKRKNETTDREAPLVAQIKDLKEQEKVFGTQIKNCRDEESTLNEQYKRLKAQLKGVEKRIDEENRKLRDGNQEKRSALLRQQKQAELEKRKMEKDEADQRDKILELEHKMAGFEHDRSRLQGEQDRLRKEVANSEGMMRTFQTTQRNQMTAYGPNIPALLAAIDQERGWRQKPVGPIGRHLKLKDVRWAGVLESVLGNTLNAFCVTNIHDRNLLQQLARRSRCDNIPILTGSDEAFDYSRGEPEADVQTILRVLDIETPFLTRQLINSVQIEQSALVEARAQGDELMRQNRRNVKLCYSMDMYRLGGGRGVGSSTITLVSHRGAPRLTTDIELRMRDLQATHQKDQAALRIVDRELDNLQQEWRELNEEKVQCRQRIPILQRQARDRHSEMERLDEDLREDEPTNIGALVEAKKDFETEMAKVPDQLQKVYERIDGLEKEIKPISERRLAIRLQIEEMQKQSRELQPRMEKAATDRLKAHNDMLHWRNELTKLRPNEDGLQASVSICEKELERRTEAAEGHCERVTAGKDVKHYEKQIEVAEQQLQIAAKRHGISIEAITTQVKQYSEAFEKARVEIVAMKEVLTMLNSAVATRLEKWRRWRRIIAVRAKNLFSNNLSRRGYSGSLTFDHENQKLTLTVRTEEALNGHQDKDPKSLSGGEKSFATICLLLALWESIGCPIRCLDEFDVFMDAVNRQISMSMMIEVAKVPTGIQYILITPQAMTEHKGDDRYVRTIKLRDPDRNQGTLAF